MKFKSLTMIYIILLVVILFRDYRFAENKDAFKMKVFSNDSYYKVKEQEKSINIKEALNAYYAFDDGPRTAKYTPASIRMRSQDRISLPDNLIYELSLSEITKDNLKLEDESFRTISEDTLSDELVLKVIKELSDTNGLPDNKDDFKSFIASNAYKVAITEPLSKAVYPSSFPLYAPAAGYYNTNSSYFVTRAPNPIISSEGVIQNEERWKTLSKRVSGVIAVTLGDKDVKGPRKMLIINPKGYWIKEIKGVTDDVTEYPFSIGVGTTSNHSFYEGDVIASAHAETGVIYLKRKASRGEGENVISYSDKYEIVTRKEFYSNVEQ